MIKDNIAISDDGRFVGFNTYDSGLVPNDPFSRDTFLHDRLTGITEMVNVNSDRIPSNGETSGWLFINADGTVVAFNSKGTNLAGTDNNTTWDVYARVRDLDADFYVDDDDDGFTELYDCNDSDPQTYNGAPEVKHDGVDQDCNGYDLTIDVSLAEYNSRKDTLKIEATSALKAGASLSLADTPMTYVSNKYFWELTLDPAGGDPGTVEVCGTEGCETAQVSVK